VIAVKRKRKLEFDLGMRMMALHKQQKKKKQYPVNATLYPGFKDKMLIHYDNEAKCYRVTHYSRFAESGKVFFMGLSKTDFGGPWRRREWTYQRAFETEIDALQFAKDKVKQRKLEEHVIYLLQIEP
jgi:hypothetical protein